MSASGLDKAITRTPEQAKAEIARKDRQGWFPGRHAGGEFGILSARDGREVARCASEEDRDFLLLAVRGFHTMRTVLEAAKASLEEREYRNGDDDLLAEIDAALATRGGKPWRTG